MDSLAVLNTNERKMTDVFLSFAALHMEVDHERMAIT
jgi:hypothetical protein